ncbi:MAG: Hint domain-containing protein [Pseudomonadota bacterium]
MATRGLHRTSGPAHATRVRPADVISFGMGELLCFTPGTRLATPRGTVAVETLVRGDLVLTRDHGAQPIRWISRTAVTSAEIAADPALAPVLIPRGSLAPNRPVRDMWVSPQHRMLVAGSKPALLFNCDEVLVPARALSNVRRTGTGTRYIGLLFDRHQIVFANGAQTESLHAGRLAKGRMSLSERAELFRLFPTLRTAPEDFGPPVRRALGVGEGRLLA